MSLKVGTIEEIEVQPNAEPYPPSKKRGGGNSPAGGNNRGGGGGGGGDRPEDNDPESDVERFNPDKYRVGMGLILLIVLMTFGGLIAAYVVLATNRTLEWKPFELPRQVWFSVALILLSEVFYFVAKRKLFAGDQAGARLWFMITSATGAIFIASQALAWINLVNQGYYAAGNPYAGFFYILTAVHALHVLGGIISLGYIVLKTQIITDDEDELLKRRWFAAVIGWYWRFLTALWLVLFVLLEFYK